MQTFIREPGCTMRGTISALFFFFFFFYIYFIENAIKSVIFIYFSVKSWLTAKEKAKKISENIKLSLNRKTSIH